MMTKYTITDKMVSSIISISEKIGRIKEIRNIHRHIDFDRACMIKNIQRILNEKNIIYPDKVISDILNSEDLKQPDDIKVILSIIEFHSTHLINKDLDINSYIELYNQYLEKASVWTLNRVIDRSDFFLYYITDFCNECNYTTPDYFIEGWLINRFYKEYGITFSLAYSDYLKEHKQENDLFNMLPEVIFIKDLLRNELFLSVIHILLDECLEYYYELSNPKSNRVEQLRGTIKEPFSRKEYLSYHNKMSTATASPDLSKAVESGIIIKKGDKINARYWYKNQ